MAIYAWATGDVIPTETSQIVSVDAVTGVLDLKRPLARSFSTPLIAKVTSLATTNVGMKNLIVQGTEPLAVTETFGFTAENNQFLLDCSVGGGNVTGLNMNTVNGFRFGGNTSLHASVPRFPSLNCRNATARTAASRPTPST